MARADRRPDLGNTEELVALGASVVRRRDDDIEWDVLADPEGNEFCCFEPRADDD